MEVLSVLHDLSVGRTGTDRSDSKRSSRRRWALGQPVSDLIGAPPT